MRTDTFDSRVARVMHPGEIDEVIIRARRLQTEAFNRLLQKAVAGVASLARELRRRREYRLAHETLLRMEDRELRDIGICRGDITRMVYGPKGHEGAWTRLKAAIDGLLGAWRGRSVAGDALAALDQSRPGRSDTQAAPRGTPTAPQLAANDDCPREVA